MCDNRTTAFGSPTGRSTRKVDTSPCGCTWIVSAPSASSASAGSCVYTDIGTIARTTDASVTGSPRESSQ